MTAQSGETGRSSSPTSLDGPVFVSAPAAQVSGNDDGYAGSVEIVVPVTGTVEGCVAAVNGTDVSGTVSIIGYLLPA